MIQKLSDKQLIIGIITKVKEEKQLLSQVLQYLEEIDHRKLYVDYGVNSLFKFCTRILKYSDAESAIRVKAMRATKQEPTLKKKISSGEINLSTAANLNTFFSNNKTENKKSIIEKVIGKNTNESKQLLESLSSTSLPKTKKIMLQERILKKLEKIQKEFENCSELEAIEALIDKHLEVKARNKPKRTSNITSKNQRYITRDTKEYVDARAQGRCEGVSSITGKRCNSRSNLQYDHFQSIAFGGSSNKKNIRKLCFSYNQREGVKQLGVEKMSQLAVLKTLHSNNNSTATQLTFEQCREN